MRASESRNRKYIDAVLKKAEKACPGALSLLGIYGSAMTGDTTEKSDLDLLILAKDERARELQKTFIEEDSGVGYDFYLTTWEQLEEDARYTHPNISRLMDAHIVWCAGEEERARLEALREKVRAVLSAPFSPDDYRRAEGALREAEYFFAEALLEKELPKVRQCAGNVLYCLENALALLNKTYFRLGVKRAYEELSAMKDRPEDLIALIERAVSGETAEEVWESLKALLRAIRETFRRKRETVSEEKAAPSKDSLTGTYEEIWSNWRNKLFLAAETGDRHLAFQSLGSANEMLRDIREAVDIGDYDVMACYDPADLRKTAEAFAEVTDAYLKEYGRAGIAPAFYRDADAFIREYGGEEDEH